MSHHLHLKGEILSVGGLNAWTYMIELGYRVIGGTTVVNEFYTDGVGVGKRVQVVVREYGGVQE